MEAEGLTHRFVLEVWGQSVLWGWKVAMEKHSLIHKSFAVVEHKIQGLHFELPMRSVYLMETCLWIFPEVDFLYLSNLC